MLAQVHRHEALDVCRLGTDLLAEAAKEPSEYFLAAAKELNERRPDELGFQGILGFLLSTCAVSVCAHTCRICSMYFVHHHSIYIHMYIYLSTYLYTYVCIMLFMILLLERDVFVGAEASGGGAGTGWLPLMGGGFCAAPRGLNALSCAKFRDILRLRSGMSG